MVELRNIAVLFHAGTPDQRVALDDVTLQLAQGSFSVVVGTNGAGKSTLLNVIAGALRARAGRVLIDDTDVTDWPVHRRAGLVARVFQDPMIGTAPALTVEQNLALASMRGKPRWLQLALNAQRRRSFRERLAAFGLGLEDRMQSTVGLLSGGQRQVLALVMATLNRPHILLLDEHTAALDPRTAQLVMDATTQVVESQRLTTLMITHNMQQAVDHGDRLLMMDAGRIKLDVSGADKAELSVAAIVQRFGLAADHLLLQTTA